MRTLRWLLSGMWNEAHYHPRLLCLNLVALAVVLVSVVFNATHLWLLSPLLFAMNAFALAMSGFVIAVQLRARRAGRRAARWYGWR